MTNLRHFLTKPQRARRWRGRRRARAGSAAARGDEDEDDRIGHHTMPTSLPPIGSPVKLADGRRGVVTDHLPVFTRIAPDDGTKPVHRMPKNVEVVSSAGTVSTVSVSSDDASVDTMHTAHDESFTSSLSCNASMARRKERVIHFGDAGENGLGNSNRVTTRSHAHPMKGNFPFSVAGYRIGTIKLLLPGQEDPLLTRTLAGVLFDDRLFRLEFKSISPSKLYEFKAPKTIQSEGFRFELLGKKVHSEKATFGRLARPELYYVITGGPGLKEIYVEEHLNAVADFGAIGNPGKIASRIELLFSPTKAGGILKLDSNDYEFIDEDADTAKCSEGNFHAPKSFFSKLIANKVCEQKHTTVQVRFLLDGKLGKGTLTMRDGIDKIQIPPSMIKVGASTTSSRRGPSFIAVTKSFPSRKNVYMGKYLQGEILCATALDELQKPISAMFQDVLRDKGVPDELISEYNKGKTKGKQERHQKKKIMPRRSNRLKHQKPKAKTAPPQDGAYFADAYVIGVADPTPLSTIPTGHVVVPGLPESITSILVSRAPAMDKGDMLRLPVFKTSLLDHHHFGEICFGNGSVPLPNLIANGDLDGDLYFIIWDEAIVESVPMSDVATLERRVDGASKKRATRSKRDCIESPLSEGKSWFDAMQDIACDVGLDVRISKLIKILYNESKAELDSDNVVYEDYVAYGRAYKAALDLKKHGDSVELPDHLWEPFPENLREFLSRPFLA